jgi:hypothetical protein
MATALDEDIEDVPVLVNGAPQVVTLAVNREEDLIEMPRVARSGTLPPELMGILLTKFPALLPDGFIGHADSAFEEELFDIAVAEAAAKIQPHRMADDLGREAVILVAVGAYWCSHPSSISHPTTAQQVDIYGPAHPVQRFSRGKNTFRDRCSHISDLIVKAFSTFGP